MKKDNGYNIVYYSYLVFFALFVYLIINTVSIAILFDISLKTRTLQVDYITRVFIEYDPVNLETGMNCFGIRIEYYEYFSFITFLMIINYICGFILAILLIVRIKFRKKIMKIKKFGFLSLSFLVILMILLHHIPAILHRIGNYDSLVRIYNRSLIYFELINENIYTYFYNVEFKNTESIVNLVIDVILYVIIGYVIFLSIWFSVYRNKKETQIVYLLIQKEELDLLKNEKKRGIKI